MVNEEKIVLMRLSTHEDIVCEYISKNNEYVKVKTPVKIVVIPSKSQQNMPTVAFAPWAEFTNDEHIEINILHVMSTMKPVKEFINQYKSMFSKVIMPQSNIITP